MLSNPSKYVVKALVYLVNNSSETHKVQAIEIALNCDIPKPLLSKLLRQLSSKNMISSTKGPNGGFYLSEAQLKGSLLDIIVEVEGKDRLKMCVLNFDKCNAQNPCPIHFLVSPEKDELRNKFKNIRLENLR